MSVQPAEVNLDIFRKYAGISLPRHVSYPMPSWWHEMDAAEATSLRKESNENQPAYDISLYLHIPFCETLCKFCACNKIIQSKGSPGAQQRTENYLKALEKEIRQLSKTVSANRKLKQIHWGGGSPTYLTPDQIETIHRAIDEVFTISHDAEISMEIDPRTSSFELLKTIRRIGFNRVSMGVQDFDEQVQSHVRRIQPLEMVRETVEQCRELNFDSVNFDLIYGMPYQTPKTIRDTVEKSIDLSPDRIAYYHYAQIPEKIATQRGMDYTRLPDSESKLQMFLIGLEMFEEAGYEFIGLDHFARSDEGLVDAFRDGTLQRNFQGMTTGGGLDLIGAGVSSISHFRDKGFLQNYKDVDRYVGLIENVESLVERGCRLTFDDRVRQFLIDHLYAYAEIKPDDVEQRFEINFKDYFARELGILEELEQDQLVVFDTDGVIRVTIPLGRVLLRNVAAVFDAYLSHDAYRSGTQTNFSANA